MLALAKSCSVPYNVTKGVLEEERKFGFMENVRNLNLQTAVLTKKYPLKHQLGENKFVIYIQVLFATPVGITYHKMEIQQ